MSDSYTAHRGGGSSTGLFLSSPGVILFHSAGEKMFEWGLVASQLLLNINVRLRLR